MSGGVALGANMPVQMMASTSAPASFMVGTSGKSSIRFCDVTASARTVPDFTCGDTGRHPRSSC